MRFFMIDWFVITCYFVCATKVQQKKHIRKSAVLFFCLVDGQSSTVYWTLRYCLVAKLTK